MTDEELLRATLLALTRQNVTGNGGGTPGYIGYAVLRYDRYGYVTDVSAVIGEYGE